ncbi:hypothetical protein STEG23_011430, partial [Scotinomys teguina]
MQDIFECEYRHLRRVMIHCSRITNTPYVYGPNAIPNKVSKNIFLFSLMELFPAHLARSHIPQQLVNMQLETETMLSFVMVFQDRECKSQLCDKERCDRISKYKLGKFVSIRQNDKSEDSLE